MNAKRISGALMVSLVIHGIIMLIASAVYIAPNCAVHRVLWRSYSQSKGCSECGDPSIERTTAPSGS